MNHTELATQYLAYLNNLNDHVRIGDWEYLGKTDTAFGTPSGSWAGIDGFKFRNANNGSEFLLRSIPREYSYLVIESYQIPGQLYNMSLTDNKVHKIQQTSSKI